MADYIYSDVDYGLEIDSLGNVKVLTDKDAIIQSLRIILASLIGEHPRSMIGSNLIRYLGEEIDDEVAEDIEDEITDAINQYEKRFQITQVQAIPQPDQNSYSIKIFGVIPEIRERVAYNTVIRTY